MMKRKAAVASAFALLMIGSASRASADVFFYTDPTSYTSAVSAAGLSLSSFNFNSTSTSGNYATAAGLTIDGVNFVGLTGTAGYYSLGVTPPYFCCDDYNNPNATLQAPAVSSSFYNIANGSTSITLPGGAEAFSLDAYTVQAGDYDDTGHDTLNLEVAGSTGQTMTLPGSSTGFIGFISTSPISSIALTGSTPDDFIDIVDGSVGVEPGSITPTPEPGYFPAIAGLCLAGVFASRWRNRQKSA